MRWLGFFGKGPLPPQKIAKIAKLASNPFAQPDVRMREMQRLLDDGSESALRGVLKRFSANAQGHIADEEEKQWLEDTLVQQCQERALAPLRDFIGHAEQLTYALRAYRRIAGDEEAVRHFLAVLAHYGPEDHRSSEAKLQLIWQLSESQDDARVLPGLAPFLLDHSDDVRCAVLDIFAKAVADAKGLNPEVAQQVVTILEQVLSDADSAPRLQRRAAEFLVACSWPLPSSGTPLAPSLEQDYFLDKKRILRRRVVRRAGA